MTQVGHFIAGQKVSIGQRFTSLYNPSTGQESGRMVLASDEDVDSAVSAARAALPKWRGASIGFRAEMMLELRQVIRANRNQLAETITTDMGKTIADAQAEVDRGIEALAASGSVGSWLAMPSTSNVSVGVDVREIRFPIGVIAAISPFNFPAMVPILQTATAIACGNTVIVKPSERDPTATVRVAELFQLAGLPDGVFNVVTGDRTAVERLLRHPDVAGISFVGSTSVARHIREVAVANNKRVQAFGGGKNHMVVMPDADLNVAADAAVSAAFGAAGQRCMAVSVLVAVGGIGDALVAKISSRLATLKTGGPTDPSVQMGPVITGESRDRVVHYLGEAEKAGATLVIDGRGIRVDAAGYFVGPSLIDHVSLGSPCHTDEIFGPVLSMMRAASFEEALAIIGSHSLANGAAIFTSDGATARRFVEEAEVGQVGVNVAIPVPVAYHNFGGWKDSAFSDTKLFGPAALNFCTQIKAVTTRWPDPVLSKVDLGFSSSR